jgi:hypothetical protein
MPTPVGPAPRDPDDPDFWDWDDPVPDEKRGHRLQTIIAVVALLGLIALIMATVL